MLNLILELRFMKLVRYGLSMRRSWMSHVYQKSHIKRQIKIGISNFWFNSLGIRLREFCPIFEIAWVALTPTAERLKSKDGEFLCAYFDPYKRFIGGYPPTQTPTQEKKFDFRCSVKGNWFGFGILRNDF